MSDDRDRLTIEVFADVLCPFTHVGLRRFVQKRASAARDVVLWVRSWPLEVVNGEPLEAGFVADEVAELRAQVAPDLFGGFDPDAFPSTSLPALALGAAGYRRDATTGEAVALALRDLVFEQGRDVADRAVLDEVAARFGLDVTSTDVETVTADHDEGVARGVVGSPHFFTPEGSFFCPSLDISRDDEGELHVRVDQRGFEQFVDACFG
jgi:predicted DsbA family dithiol-disulfide isomerase